jgi:hypothetical protein
MILVSWATNEFPYVSRNVTTDYEVLTSVIFPGSDVVGTPTTIKLLKEIDTDKACTVQVYDATNGGVVAETSIGGTAREIVDLGVLSNIPTGEAEWQVKVKCDEKRGPEVRLCSMMIA